MTMPTPPATVVISPHEYRVILDTEGLLVDDRVGQCDSKRLIIALDAEQAWTQMADTLLHEIAHAILAPAGLEDEIEERVCLAMGPGLLALVRDNPELLQWLRRR